MCLSAGALPRELPRCAQRAFANLLCDTCVATSAYDRHQDSPLSRDSPPRQELVAKNGLFQPKLKLAQKSPKLTPRPDPPEVGTRQLTLCPSSTNSLEPSPNLVPSEVPASANHGFVKWGHDAKITKTGVIPTRGSPSQGKANSSQDRRQDLGLISECTT